MVSGIYGITHVASGRVYIGQAADISKRWSTHKAQLARKKHHCIFLQNLWNKYGPHSFIFGILELCPVKTLDVKEQYWFDKTPANLLINTNKLAGHKRGYTLTKETKAKMSASASNVGKDPAQKRVRSVRAKNQHLSGNLGAVTWKKPRIPKFRICRKCKQGFIPHVVSGTVRTGSKYCPKCRPPHRGGRYLYQRSDSISTRKCRKCREEFIPEVLASGSRSQSDFCKECRPIHKGGCYRHLDHP